MAGSAETTWPAAPVETTLLTQNSTDWYSAASASMPGHDQAFPDSRASVETQDGAGAAWVVATASDGPDSPETCSQFVADNLAKKLLGVLEGGQVTEAAVRKAFTDTDAALRANPGFVGSLSLSGVSVSAAVAERRDGTVTVHVAGLGSQLAAVVAADGRQVEAGHLGLSDQIGVHHGLGYWALKDDDDTGSASLKVEAEPIVHTMADAGEGAFVMVGSEGMFKTIEPSAVGDWLVGHERARKSKPHVITDVAYIDVSSMAPEVPRYSYRIPKKAAKVTPLGRITFGLFGEEVPKTVNNFKALCTGERGYGYKLSQFVNASRDAFAVGGEIVEDTGNGLKSIYDGANGPGVFDVESYSVLHNDGGMISMIPNGYRVEGGRPGVGSAFLVSVKPMENHDMMLPAFGKVVDGFDVLKRLTDIPVDENMKSNGKERVVISSCGVVPSEDDQGGQHEVRSATSVPGDGMLSEFCAARVFELLRHTFLRKEQTSITATVVRLGRATPSAPSLVLAPGRWREMKYPADLRRHRHYFEHVQMVLGSLGPEYAHSVGQMVPRVEKWLKEVDQLIDAQEIWLRSESARKNKSWQTIENERVEQAKTDLDTRLTALPALSGSGGQWWNVSGPVDACLCVAFVAMLLLGLGFVYRGFWQNGLLHFGADGRTTADTGRLPPQALRTRHYGDAPHWPLGARRRRAARDGATESTSSGSPGQQENLIPGVSGESAGGLARRAADGGAPVVLLCLLAAAAFLLLQRRRTPGRRPTGVGAFQAADASELELPLALQLADP